MVKSGRRFPYQYLQIFQEVVGKNVAIKIRSEILISTKQLIKFPESGQEEELLRQLNEGHRYLVKGHHKIIYKPVEEGILITDVFDTRQNPIKMNTPERK